MTLPSPQLEKRAKLAFKLESAKGTAEALTLAEVKLVFNPKFTPNIQMNERAPAQNTLSQPADIPGLRSAVVSFEVELQGSGTAGTAPFYGDMLKACGCEETIVAVTSVTYTPGPADPTSSDVPTATLAVQLDGKLYKIWGARGDAQILWNAVGEPARIRFTFTGADFSESETALATGSTTWPTVTPPVFMGATLTLDAAAVAKVSSLSMSMGNEVQLRKDVSKTSGHIYSVITRRKPTVTLDPETLAIATYDYLGKWRAGTLVALINAIGATAGNICTFNAPKVQYVGMSPAAREGINTLDINCKLTQNAAAGNDEFSLALT